MAKGLIAKGVQQFCYLMLKSIKIVDYKVGNPFNTYLTRFLFYCNKFKVGSSLKSTGRPYLSLAVGGKALIGNDFKMNNSLSANPIGRSHKCVIVVGPKATLSIGNNVGISFTSIVCHKNIIIRDNVLIGGGCCIYDSDFHPLNPEFRKRGYETTLTDDVIIEESVFIGTNSTILKGVTIGMNSIVGACSVVAKSIPPNEIWAGNPARFIRKVE